jgi:uncharacterized membrane protein
MVRGSLCPNKSPLHDESRRRHRRETLSKAAEHDYRINVKAELEIELLHEKIDKLREREVLS